MRKSPASLQQHGFLPLTAILSVFVVILLGLAAGYGVYQKQKASDAKSELDQVRTENTSNKSQATGDEPIFTPESAFGENLRREINRKVIEPFLDYYQNSINVDITSIKISPGPDDNSYSFQYTQSGSNTTLGFLIQQPIEYWYPELCDPGGCLEYPEEFKEKFPESFQAYQKAQTAKNQ